MFANTIQIVYQRTAFLLKKIGNYTMYIFIKVVCAYMCKNVINACIDYMYLYVNPTNSNIDRPWIVPPSSIHPPANSKLVPCPLTPYQLVFTTMVLSIDYLSLCDRRSVIERTLNSFWWPTVPATKRRRLCVFATKLRRLRVTYPSLSLFGRYCAHTKSFSWMMLLQSVAHAHNQTDWLEIDSVT